MSVKKYVKNKGMTLIELLIAITLISSIIVPIGMVFITNYIAYYKDNAKIKASYEMRHALSEVLSNFRSAEQDSIVLLEDESKVTYDIVENATAYSCAVWYSSDDKCLKITTPGGDKTILADVANVNIGYTPDGRISIEVTTTTKLPVNDIFIYTQTYDYKKRTLE